MDEAKAYRSIRKLRELAERGVGGEKENAKRLLTAICQKYNINPDEVGRKAHGVLRPRKILIRDDNEMGIFVQVIARFSGHFDRASGLRYGDRKGASVFKHVVLTELDDLEWAEVSEAWRFFRKLFDEEKKTLANAIIVRHNLYNQNPEKKNRPEETDEEIEERRRAARMAHGLSDKNFNPTKLLKNG